MRDTPSVVIADAPSVRDLVELWLDDAYEVRPAASERDVLANLDDTVETVVFEWQLPQVSGTDLVGRIRRDRPDVRIVVVATVEPECRVDDLDVDACLVKPFDAATFRRHTSPVESSPRPVV